MGALLNKDGAAFIEEEVQSAVEELQGKNREFWSAEERVYKEALKTGNFFEEVTAKWPKVMKYENDDKLVQEAKYQLPSLFRWLKEKQDTYGYLALTTKAGEQQKVLFAQKRDKAKKLLDLIEQFKTKV